MNTEYPVFEAKPGTVISVFSVERQASSICGYCRLLVLEDDHFRFVGGFRRYTARRVSWAEPVEWAVTPVSQVTIHVAPEKAWMQFSTRPDTNPHPEK